jgi:hypothetical protein
MDVSYLLRIDTYIDIQYRWYSILSPNIYQFLLTIAKIQKMNMFFSIPNIRSSLPVFSGGLVARLVICCVMFWVLLFILFLLATVLSVFLRFTPSDYKLPLKIGSKNLFVTYLYYFDSLIYFNRCEHQCIITI